MPLNVDSLALDDFERNTDLFQLRLAELLKKYPDTPVLSQFPRRLKTRRHWRRFYSRKILSGEKPAAIVRWEREIDDSIRRIDGVTGETTVEERKRVIAKPVMVFEYEQTKLIKKQARTIALEDYWNFFGEHSHPKYKVAYQPDGGCLTWYGKITEEELRGHIGGERDFAVRTSGKSRFVGIDLDLHGGCPQLFLRQLEVLLGEFWGKDTWHIQIKRQNAGGVHLLKVLEAPEPTAGLISSVRTILLRLDAEHPELAAAAVDRGMRPLADIEVLPTKMMGLRLPLAAGRVMLLDRPLELATYRKRKQHDVVGYVAWLRSAMAGSASFMPKQEVMDFVAARLPNLMEKERDTSPIIVPLQTTNAKVVAEKPVTAKSYGNGGSYKGMKGKTWQLLTKAWLGGMEPNSLNHWIRQLSLYAPFKFSSPADAVAAIERFIDELPDHTFSDRLIAGERAKISAIIRYDVKQAFAGWQGQADPETSAKKLKAVWEKWQSTGRDPFDKSTWGESQPTSSMHDVELGDDFEWDENESEQLHRFAAILKTEFSKAAAAVKLLIRLIKLHPEVPRTWLVELLTSHGIPASSKRLDKPRRLIEALVELKWIYIEAKHAQGRCRRYGLGTMRVKYGSTQAVNSLGCDMDELYYRLRESVPALCLGT